MKSLVLGSKTFRSLGPFFFLIQRFPCVCGSIIKDQRELAVQSTPFSVEKLSVGSPCMFQSRTSVALAMKEPAVASAEANVKSELKGSWNSFTGAAQRFSTMPAR